MTLVELKELLHSNECSCVISNGGSTSLYYQRGVSDLFELLTHHPEVLDGAMIADKVVGKGAAALMILGGVDSLYTDVISVPALKLLRDSSVYVEYAKAVPNIINRSGTGICPVETLCMPFNTAGDCLPLIRDFITKMNNK